MNGDNLLLLKKTCFHVDFSGLLAFWVWMMEFNSKKITLCNSLSGPARNHIILVLKQPAWLLLCVWAQLRGLVLTFASFSDLGIQIWPCPAIKIICKRSSLSALTIWNTVVGGLTHDSIFSCVGLRLCNTLPKYVFFPCYNCCKAILFGFNCWILWNHNFLENQSFLSFNCCF